MPSNLDLLDEEAPLSFKFDGCELCVNRCDPEICADCESGEYFEEEGPLDLLALLNVRSA